MACGSPDLSSTLIGSEPTIKSESTSTGFVMHDSGGIDHHHVHGRISATWTKWQEVIDVVCDLL